MRILAAFVLAACSSPPPSGDAGLDAALPDAPSDATEAACVASDATFTCDVSSVPASELSCGDWTGTVAPDDAGLVSCPAAGFDWSSGGNSNGTCTYTWMKSGAPNLCELPASGGSSAFTWLHGACDGGTCP